MVNIVLWLTESEEDVLNNVCENIDKFKLDTSDRAMFLLEIWDLFDFNKIPDNNSSFKIIFELNRKKEVDKNYNKAVDYVIEKMVEFILYFSQDRDVLVDDIWDFIAILPARYKDKFIIFLENIFLERWVEIFKEKQSKEELAKTG